MTDTLYWLNLARQIMLTFPATEEYMCYRTPAFRVKKKMVLSEFPKNSFNSIVSDSFVGAGIQVATTPKSVESL